MLFGPCGCGCAQSQDAILRPNPQQRSDEAVSVQPWPARLILHLEPRFHALNRREKRRGESRRERAGSHLAVHADLRLVGLPREDRNLENFENVTRHVGTWGPIPVPVMKKSREQH